MSCDYFVRIVVRFPIRHELAVYSHQHTVILPIHPPANFFPSIQGYYLYHLWIDRSDNAIHRKTNLIANRILLPSAEHYRMPKSVIQCASLSDYSPDSATDRTHRANNTEIHRAHYSPGDETESQSSDSHNHIEVPWYSAESIRLHIAFYTTNLH